MRKIFLKKKIQILSAFLCVLMLIAASAVFSETLSEDDYDVHQHGGPSAACIFAKAVTVTRAELAECKAKEDLEAIIIERTEMVAGQWNNHNCLGGITEISITQFEFEKILAEQSNSEDQTFNITLFVSHRQFPGLMGRMVEIPFSISGEKPTIAPLTSEESSEESSTSEETTTTEELTVAPPPKGDDDESSDESSEESSTTESSTSLRPTHTKSRPTSTTTEIVITNESTWSESSETTSKVPISSVTGSGSEIIVETNESVYDTMSTAEEINESLEDEILIADISGAIISTQSANQSSSNWPESIPQVMIVGANVLTLAGFGVSIGADIRCIRHIRRK